jgi:hypothetical protein
VKKLCLGQNCQAVSSNKKVFHRIGNSIHSGLAELPQMMDGEGGAETEGVSAFTKQWMTFKKQI